MSELSDETWEKIRTIFTPEYHEEVARILANECGNNLPFQRNTDKFGLERFRFAALKLSNGRIDKLHRAVELAKKDWRDLLVAAGFGETEAHKQWQIK